MTLKIYPASSWANAHYPDVVRTLRANGHCVFDFREANSGFRWPPCSTWREYIRQLESDPLVAAAFKRDRDALDWCNVCVLILPCGRSAHLEAMYASAHGKLVVVLFGAAEPLRPDLMYLLLGVGPGGLHFATSIDQLLGLLAALQARKQNRDLAEHAWTLSNSDPVRAVEILREWTNLGFNEAFAAIEKVLPPDRDAAP